MIGCLTGKECASEASSSGRAGDALGLGYASEDSDAEGAPDSAAGASIANPAEPLVVEPEPEPPTTAHAAAGTDSQGAEAAGEEVAPAATEADQAQARLKETARAQQSMETSAVAPRSDTRARGDAGGAGTAGMGQGERSEPAAAMTGSEPPAPDAASAGDAVDGASVAERLVGAPPGSGAGEDNKGPAGFIGPQAPENGSLAAPMAFLKGDRHVPLGMPSL